MFRTSCVQHQEDYNVLAVFICMFSMHLCKQSARLKNVLWHVQYSLPYYEHKMFETSRKQEEMNENISLNL